MNFRNKRIRGLRRHFRNLRQQAKHPSELRSVDWEWLVRFQRTSLRVIADPWMSCKEVPCKQEFRALWIRRFLQTFPHWHTQLEGRYSAFYLAIHLHEPTAESFCLSRLVVAVNEQRLLYEDIYGIAQNRPLPSEYLAIDGIEDLDWQAYANWSSPYTLEEFERAGDSLSYMPHKMIETKSGEPGMIVLLGWVWVGQLGKQQ